MVQEQFWSSYQIVWIDQEERKLVAVTDTLFSSEIMISMVEHEWQHSLFVAISKECCTGLDFSDLNRFPYDKCNIIVAVRIYSSVTDSICGEIDLNRFSEPAI